MALGIEPSTLPRTQRDAPIEPVRPLLVDPSFRLTDAEWQMFEPLMPKPPVPQPGIAIDDRLFLGRLPVSAARQFERSRLGILAR